MDYVTIKNSPRRLRTGGKQATSSKTQSGHSGESQETDKTTDNKNVKKDLNSLFTEAIFYQKFDLAFEIWRRLEQSVISALYAVEMISMLKSFTDNEDEILEFNNQIRRFENLAISTVNLTYENYPDNIYNLLSFEWKNWRESSCLILALKNNLGGFLSQQPCMNYNEALWDHGYIKNDNKEIESKCCCCSLSDRVRCCCSCVSIKKEIKQHVREALSLSVLALFRGIGHGTFVILFAIWLVSVLSVDSFSWLDGLLWSYVLTFALELINQIKENPMRHRKSCWSLFDYIEITAILLFVLTFLLHMVAHRYQYNTLLMAWTRVLFSMDFILFCVMTLEFCYTNRFLGPTLIIITKMALKLIQFLLVILVFFISFAVASQAVLYPNSTLNSLVSFTTIKRPFWSLFGDFSFDELDPSSCTENTNTNDTDNRCPTEFGSYFVQALMGVYVIIVNILLFNLLIALFNSDIVTTDQKAAEIWHHQTLTFTFELSKTIFLPPPFTIVFPLLWFLRGKYKNYPFGRKESKLEAKLMNLKDIETEQRDLCLVQIDSQIENTFVEVYKNVQWIKDKTEFSRYTIDDIYWDVQWIKNKLCEKSEVSLSQHPSSSHTSIDRTPENTRDIQAKKTSISISTSTEPVKDANELSKPLISVVERDTQTENKSVSKSTSTKPVSGRLKPVYEPGEENIKVIAMTPREEEIWRSRKKSRAHKRFYIVRSKFMNRLTWTISPAKKKKKRKIYQVETNRSHKPEGETETNTSVSEPEPDLDGSKPEHSTGGSHSKPMQKYVAKEYVQQYAPKSHVTSFLQGPTSAAYPKLHYL